MIDDRRELLKAWAAECIGVQRVTLREFLGGAANAGFEVTIDAQPEPVAFLRTNVDDRPDRLGYTLQREGAIVEVAGRLGFPVAPVLGARAEPDALLLGFMPGVSRPDATEIERVAPRYLALIAAVHATDPTMFPVEQHPTMHAAMAAELNGWTLDAFDRGVIDQPLIALGARVLAETMPAGNGAPSLVHGDVGAGNFLALDGEVSAMLDWEQAHLGDPHEDLAWMWMRGAHTDFGDPATRLREYETAAGITVDHDRLAWHVGLVMWKSSIVLHGRLRRSIPGELAMIPLVVALTYGFLLGAQLVQILGGANSGSTPVPRPTHSVVANLADELLHVTDLAADRRVVLEYLRDSAALADWQRTELEGDCAATIGVRPDQLTDHIRSCGSGELLSVATVLAAAAQRAALASPKSSRRI